MWPLLANRCVISRRRRARLLAFETSGSASLGVRVQKNQQNRCRSTPQQTIQPDAAENADSDCRGIDVCEFGARIYERDHHQRGQAAGDRGERYLSRDLAAVTRTAVGVGEVTVAAWTGRHWEHIPD